jgi:hypothetical protein
MIARATALPISILWFASIANATSCSIHMMFVRESIRKAFSSLD